MAILDFSEYEDMSIAQEMLSSYLEKCRLEKRCPTCTIAYTAGMGTGRLSDGTFCSLQCFAEFKAKNSLFYPRSRD